MTTSHYDNDNDDDTLSPGPQFVHDCETCIFLGRYTLEGTKDGEESEEYDLYWCVPRPGRKGLPAAVARFGDRFGEQYSGLPVLQDYYNTYPEFPLHEAYRRAKEQVGQVPDLR